MMELAQTINNCKSLYFLANKVVYTVEDKTQISTYINNISFNTYLSILNISEFHNELYYFNDSILYKILTDTIVEIFKVEDVNGVQMISDDEIFTWKKVSRKEYLYSLHQLNMLKWQITTSDTYEYIYTDYFTVFERFDETKFSMHNIQNEKLWHYSLPEGFKVYGSVQTIDDVLFFRCTDSNLDNSKNIGLNIHTGEVLWEIENTVYFQIDHKNKLLRGYQGAYYQVVDPFSGKLLVNNYLKENWDKGIFPSSQNNTITEDKLLFVSGRGENTKFGAIDLETSEIDFIQDFPLENDGQLDKPVFHQNKLYLRDTNNVLYVLE